MIYALRDTLKSRIRVKRKGKAPYQGAFLHKGSVTGGENK